MKLIAIVRAKNNIRTIGLCLQRLSDLVDEIIIVDNGSTDGTLDEYKRFPKIIKILYSNGYDEGRDKRALLAETKLHDPDWILLIDHDEVFEKNLTRNILESYMRSNYDSVSFRMCNFWLNDRDCRYDGYWFLYALRPQRQMWRNVPEAHFPEIKIHAGFVQGIGSKQYISPYRLKHYGYSFLPEAKAKYEFYKKLDPDYKNNYAHADPDGRALTYRYREFDNRTINAIWIYLASWLSSILTAVVLFKRKYFGKLKFFK